MKATFVLVISLLAFTSCLLADEFADALPDAEVQRAMQVLAADDSDPEANETVGRYDCFTRGDWDRGLPRLAKSGNAQLQAAARRDLSGATTSAEQIGLADMWWELAVGADPEVQQNLTARARHWYALALPNVTGLSKRKCEKRLGEAALAMNTPLKNPATALDPDGGSGLEFDGNAWLETNLTYDGKTPLTIEVWVTPKADGPQSIVANCHGVGLALQITEDGHWGFHVRDQTTYQGATSNEKVRLGQRVHLAGVFDGRTIGLFLNGRLQGDIGIMTSAHKVAKFRFMIGADPDFNSRPQKQFHGVIDSVHLASTVLYRHNFTPRDPPGRYPSSVLLLKLDEGEGDVAKDSSVHQQHVRVHGAKWK